MNDEIRKQAENFIKSIGKGDRVAIITDHDPDGYTSGVLFYDYCLRVGARPEQFTHTNGISTLEDFVLEDFDKIITTDKPAKFVYELFEKYRDKEILFMDHHPSDAKLPDGVIEYRTMYRGYIPSARSTYELCGGKIWIALSGMISDVADRYSENDEFIRGALEEIGMDLNGFKDKVAYEISNCILFLDDEPAKAFSLIQKLESIDDVATLSKYSGPIKKEVEGLVRSFERDKEDLGGAYFYYFEPVLNVKPVVTARISLDPKNVDKILIFASPKGDDKISISARSQTKRMDMAELLRAGINGLESANAGGHFAASGAAFLKGDLEKFKENLRERLKGD